MITRRDVPLALAAQGLAIWFGSAFGQKKGPERNEATPASPAVEADERVNQVLAPVRDEHHLPGLIGGILMGNRIAAIGALGIRKIGSPEPIRVTDQMHLGSCTKAWIAPARDFAILIATNQGGDSAAQACEQAVEKADQVDRFLTQRPRRKR